MGYDVEFEINRGGFTRSLFLQPKVSAFAESRAGRNAHFFDAHNGPYYRFPVDNDQHNTLCDLSQNRGNAFYCAPIFHLSHHLEGHFRGPTILGNSIWLDPIDVERIMDNERHNITYDAAGLNPTIHSEPRRFKESFRGDKERAPDLKSQRIDTEYVEELAEVITSRTRESRFAPSVTRDIERARPIERAQILLGRVFDVTWLLLP